MKYAHEFHGPPYKAWTMCMCSILVAIRQVTFVCKRSHVVSVFEFGVNFFQGVFVRLPFYGRR